MSVEKEICQCREEPNLVRVGRLFESRFEGLEGITVEEVLKQQPTDAKRQVAGGRPRPEDRASVFEPRRALPRLQLRRGEVEQNSRVAQAEFDGPSEMIGGCGSALRDAGKGCRHGNGGSGCRGSAVSDFSNCSAASRARSWAA